MTQNAGGPRHGSGGTGGGGGGGGTVTSVNGDPGPVVVLDASEIPFTPVGSIAATDTQAAVAEVATDYLAAISALSSVYQPLDSDLTAIAALATTAYGRSVLTQANAAALQTLAGLVIGTDVQAWDADLDAIAVLTPSNDDIIQRKAGVWTNRTIAQLVTDLNLGAVYQPLDADLTAIAALTTTAFGRGLLTLADAAAGRSALGLVIGTDVQAWNADLDDLVTQWQRATSASQANLHFHEDSDNGTNRINLTAPAAITNNVDLFLPDTLIDDTIVSLALAQTLTNKTLTTPTLTSPVVNTGVSGSAIDTDGTLAANSDTLLASQKATKTYADTKLAKSANLSDVAAAGTSRYNLHDQALATVQAVGTANVASKSGTTTIDGVSLAVGDYVLLVGQSTGAENGPWVIASGSWTRPTDYPAGGAVRSRIVQCNGGTLYLGTVWLLNTTGAITIDTTATVWAQDTNVNVQTFTSGSTSWTRPLGTREVTVIASGAGGGGGGARGQVSAANVKGGGGGGGSGGTTMVTMSGADAGASQTVAVGAAGTGGAGGANADGTDGTAGGDTTFGTLVKAGGGTGGAKGTSTTGGVNGVGSAFTTYPFEFIGAFVLWRSAPGAIASATGTAGSTAGPGGGSPVAAGGGGGGGGIDNGTPGTGAVSGGGGLGSSSTSSAAGVATSSGTANAGNAGTASAIHLGGGGGSGGGAKTTGASGTGGRGGDGGNYGGGGGGGGPASVTSGTGTGGRGGDGGAGFCMVISWL